MMRILLWLVILYIVWKIVKIFALQRGKSRRREEPVMPPFTNIQDADFEDITPKDTPEANNPPPDR